MPHDAAPLPRPSATPHIRELLKAELERDPEYRSALAACAYDHAAALRLLERRQRPDYPRPGTVCARCGGPASRCGHG